MNNLYKEMVRKPGDLCFEVSLESDKGLTMTDLSFALKFFVYGHPKNVCIHKDDLKVVEGKYYAVLNEHGFVNGVLFCEAEIVETINGINRIVSVRSNTGYVIGNCCEQTVDTSSCAHGYSLSLYKVEYVPQPIDPNPEEDQLIAEELFGERLSLPELTADRAIADEHGNRIADTYETRQAVRNHIREVYNEQFNENPPLIMDGYITPQMLSESTKELLENTGQNITNVPDGEDLTTKQGVLKLSDKPYNPGAYSGLGRVYLRKNLVGGQNLLTQAMVSKPNTIYILQYDYTLDGKSITIPEGCVLDFQGGSISNGAIKGRLGCSIYSSNIKTFDILSNIECNEIVINSEVVVDRNVSFKSPVRAILGGMIHCSKDYYVEFNGFSSELFYCLDVDGNTRFLNIEKIYPQWFGECGKKDIDSTIAVRRALWACRSGSIAIGINGVDSTLGCSLVYFTKGLYVISEPCSVFSGTKIEGENTIALQHSCICQSDYNKAGLYLHNKNYTLDNNVLNRGQGEMSFTNIKFSSNPGNVDEGEPIIKFLSNKQTVELFKGTIKDDSVLENNFHDCHFTNCWFQSASYSAIAANSETDFYADIRLHQCTFDVCTKFIEFKDKACLYLFAWDCHFYKAYFGGINVTSDGKHGHGIHAWNCEFQSNGSIISSNSDRAYTINIKAANKNGIIKLSGCDFTRLEENYGARLNLNAKNIFIDNCWFKELDSPNLYKALELSADEFITITNCKFETNIIRIPNTYDRLINLREYKGFNISNNIFQNKNTEHSFDNILQSDSYPNDYNLCIFTNNIIEGDWGNILDVKLKVKINYNNNSNQPKSVDFFAGGINYNVGDKSYTNNPSDDDFHPLGTFVTKKGKQSYFGYPIFQDKFNYGSVRPTLPNERKGHSFLNIPRNIMEWWNGEKWIDSFGNPVDIAYNGISNSRPGGVNIGFQYFDTSLNKPIWWTGSKWVDATGAEV